MDITFLNETSLLGQGQSLEAAHYNNAKLLNFDTGKNACLSYSVKEINLASQGRYKSDDALCKYCFYDLLSKINCNLCSRLLRDKHAPIHKTSLSLDEIISNGKRISQQVRSIAAVLVSQGQFS